MRKIVLLVIVLACLTGLGAAISYSPSDSYIRLNAMEEDQVFEVNDSESHVYRWYVNDTLVDTDTGVSGSYLYGPVPMRYDTVAVTVDDGTAHTWRVNNGINMTAATATMTAVSNATANLDFNMSNFTLFHGVQTTDYNNTTQIADTMFLPITGYWLDETYGVGYWFYAALVVSICALFYWKFENMTITAMVLLMLSLMVAAPATAGVLIVPAAFLNVMYIAVVIAIIGIFSGILRDW